MIFLNKYLLYGAVALTGLVPVTGFALDLPSGVAAELHEVLVDEVSGENWVRFRLLAPQIDRSQNDAPDFFALEADFPHLCAKLALPYLAEYALKADRVVISMADRKVEFGLPDPDATQYFEQFRLEDGACIWEGL